MSSPIASLVTDAVDTAVDLNRISQPRNELTEAVQAIKERHEALQGEKILLDMQIAEVEKFHKDITGKPIKEAARRALTWHLQKRSA